MNIKVSESTLGECQIRTFVDINKSQEYLIKALCAVQIMCINSKEDPEKFQELLHILVETTEKIEQLYNKELTVDPTEQF
jgi:hypothetical protein